MVWRCETHPALLVVDEIGNLPISRTGAMLFLQLMTRRYAHGSTVLTSDKGFEEWARPLATRSWRRRSSIRAVHHFHIVTMRGNSYLHAPAHRALAGLHTTPDPDASSPRLRGIRQKVATT